MATSPILPVLDQNFNDFYNTPLSNNPNITYSNVLSPDNMKLYTIGKSGTLQNALLESGEMTIDDLNEINQLMPTLQ